MKKMHKTPFAIAVGASLLPLAVNVAQAESNPFALSDLGSGYLQTAEAKSDGSDKMKDGACGEGKCGGAMMKKDGNSANDMKAMEGKCAGNAKAAPAGDAKKSESSEMKCGANMK